MQRHYLADKGPSSQSYGFSVVMYRCESVIIKKAECWTIDAFELWCWRRLFRVPWTARKFNQSILKEISPVYSLEVLMLKLKLQYFGHLTRRTDSFTLMTLMLGKIKGGKRRGQQRMRWLDGITDSMDMSLSLSWVSSGKLVTDREAWPAAVHEVTKSWTRLSDWTELLWCLWWKCAELLPSLQLCATLWTLMYQAPLSVGFFRQEYWSGFATLLQEIFPELRVQPMSPALASEFFTSECQLRSPMVKEYE